MSFRFRLGPFTFGRTGIRLSLWRRGFGFSIPLTGKGYSYGKVSIGPISKYFRSKESPSDLNKLLAHAETAIRVLCSDEPFLNKLQRNGLPWRGVQERLKEELPKILHDRDEIAYRLVPMAMDAIFGDQGSGWKTEKRQSQSGNGTTTWIVII